MTKNLKKIITFIVLSTILAYIYDFTEIDHNRIAKLHLRADSIYLSKQNRLKTIKTIDLESKVSLNSATQEELITLKGIGPKMADKIINYRLKSSFKRIEDLMQIKGIGQKKFDQIKSRLVL